MAEEEWVEEEVYQYWDDEKGEWVEEVEEEVNYDENEEVYYQFWDINKGEWVEEENDDVWEEFNNEEEEEKLVSKL